MSKGAKKIEKVLSEDNRIAKKLSKLLNFLFGGGYADKNITFHEDDAGRRILVSDIVNHEQYHQYTEEVFNKAFGSGKRLEAPDGGTFLLKEINDQLAVIFEDSTCEPAKVVPSQNVSEVTEWTSEKVNDSEGGAASVEKSHNINSEDSNQMKTGATSAKRNSKKKKEKDNKGAEKEKIEYVKSVFTEEDSADNNDEDWISPSSKSKKGKKSKLAKDKDDAKKPSSITPSSKETETTAINDSLEVKYAAAQSSNVKSQSTDSTKDKQKDSKQYPCASYDKNTSDSDAKLKRPSEADIAGVGNNSTKKSKDPAKKMDRMLAFGLKKRGIAGGDNKGLTFTEDGWIGLDEILEKCEGADFKEEEVIQHLQHLKATGSTCEYAWKKKGEHYIMKYVTPAATPTKESSARSADGHNQDLRKHGQTNGNNLNRSRGPQQKKPRESDDDIYLSKTMSYLLRHGAEKQKLQIGADGFMLVKDLLGYKEFGNYYKEEDVIRVVENNDKNRFFITRDERTGELKVRANQGHSLTKIENESLELQSITDPKEIPIVIHGTYMKNWPAIKEEGLKCMTRNHIHFARGEPGDNEVISGMRMNCEVMIYINADLAIKDGLKFFISANGVILCPGNENGVLLPKYFSEVLQRRPQRVKLL